MDHFQDLFDDERGKYEDFVAHFNGMKEENSDESDFEKIERTNGLWMKQKARLQKRARLEFDKWREEEDAKGKSDKKQETV